LSQSGVHPSFDDPFPQLSRYHVAEHGV
jgi:hypothetical protein